MAAKGIKFHFEESPEAVERKSDGSLFLKTNKGSETADCVMFATGRAPNTKVRIRTYPKATHLGCLDT